MIHPVRKIREIKKRIDSLMEDFKLFHEYRRMMMPQKAIARELLLGKSYICPVVNTYRLNATDNHVNTNVDSYDWTPEGTARFHEVMRHKRLLGLLERFYD